MISNNILETIKDAAKKATLGPYGIELDEKGGSITHCPHGDDCLNVRHDPYIAEELTKEDARYFSQLSPEVIIELIEEIEMHRSADRMA